METKHKKKSFWKRFRFPSALTLLFFIIAATAILTWVIPSGQYKLSPDGSPEAGSYAQVDKEKVPVIDEATGEAVVDEETGEIITQDVRQGAWEVLKAPLAGFLDAADVIIFILVIGGFLAVATKSGALNAGIGKVIRKLKNKKKWIIPILMTVFAAGGTIYGMQEETIAFYALVVPLVIAAGYDALTAVMIIVFGSVVGMIGSTVNPFSTGIASGFANTSIGDGIVPRLIILGLSLLAGIIFTMRHAEKARHRRAELEAAQQTNTREYRQLVPTLQDSEADAAAAATKVPRFDGKRKAVLWIFAITFVVMIISVIPWMSEFEIPVFQNLADWLVSIPVLGPILGHIVPLGDWWFLEIAMLFLLSAWIISKVSGMKEGEFTETMSKGASELLGVCLIIAVARGISIIMTDGMIADTIIHWGEQWLNGMNGSVFGVIAYIFYLPVSFLVPSTSGLATLSMPIMAPIAELGGVGKDIMVTAFQTSIGLVNMIAPTVGALIGGLALAKVDYGYYLKKSWPLFIILAVISMGVIAVAAAIS